MKKSCRIHFISALLVVCLLIGLFPVTAAAADAANVVSTLETLVGKYPYVSGGRHPNDGGFDCSGLVYYVYHTRLGCDITYEQIWSRSVPGTKISSKTSLEPGDIIFGLNNSGGWHTGIYVGNSTMVHAGSSNGVSKTSINGNWFTFRFAIRPSAITQDTSSREPCTNHIQGSYLGYEGAHPHYAYYACAVCGENMRGTETTTLPDCAECQAASRGPCINHIQGNYLGYEGIHPHYTYYACAVCGENMRGTETTTLPDCAECQAASHTEHTWDAGVETKAATLTAAGVKTYTCTGCGAAKTEKIPAWGSISLGLSDNIRILLTDKGHLQITGSGELDFSMQFAGNENFRLVDYKDFITSVSIGEGFTTIWEGALDDLSNLTSVELPSSLKTIRGASFANCTALERISIPANVSNLESSAFQGCTSLRTINVDANNPYYTSVDGVVFDDDLQVLVCFPRGKGGAYRIPDGVTTIQNHAFRWNKDLVSVEIPVSVTSIAENAFINKWDVYTGMESSPLLIVHPGSYAETFAKQSGLSYQMIESKTAAPSVTPTFTDVPAGAYYAKSVVWAVENAITTGTSTTTFSPNQTCTNAQILTFLWRAMGEPEPTISNPFSDLSADKYYYKAALWAYEKGMVNGLVFGANTLCTRSRTVTYLWHTAGRPIPSHGAVFSDVDASADYAAAVAWAVENGITTGTSTTTFSPEQTCTRGQIMTFLYRYLGE